MKKNVLVFPCGSEIGLEVHRSLSFSTHFHLVGGSSIDDHGKFVYKNYVKGIPSVDEPGFVGRINEIVDRLKIDFIVPTHDSVILKLAQEKDKGNLNCDLVTSPLATCEIARSKLKTYQFFEDILPVPKVYKDAKSLNAEQLPVFLKPEVGQGTKGTHLSKTIEEVKFYTEKDPSLLLLEYLPGREYTVDCFTDKSGNLLFCEGRERNRILNGISVNAFSVDDNRFTDMATAINSHIQLRGAWFFQVKENKENELVLMEIAPRVAGTMSLVRCKGVNLILLSLFDRLDLDISICENNYDLTLDRGLENRYKHNIDYRHVYLDLDDLVIFRNRVNPEIMAFVFQCLNKKIKVHLLTRHKKVLDDTLKKYRLSGIFDETLLIPEGEEKYLYIKEKKAIFIDDSFSERKKVHNKHGIPVFDSHMVEALLETF